MNIRNANFFDDVKTYEDYSFNTILTDPPYNLGTEWFIDENGRYEVKGKAKDFMLKWDGLDGKSLDEMFKELFRVLKYGGYLLMFGMDRQLGPLHYYAVKNGFEVNQSLYWYFVSSFPKATDVSKMLDKRAGAEREIIGKSQNSISKKDGSNNSSINIHNPDINITAPSSELAKMFDGYKYSKAPLKQMVETICVFSKPCKNKSIIDDIIELNEEMDLLHYSPKVSKKERNLGLDDEPEIEMKKTFDGCYNHNEDAHIKTEKNTHTTLKPINLIYNIFKIFKLPEACEQKVYVPFCGTFSEIIGIAKTGIDMNNVYGCEMNEKYYEIGKKRLKHFLKENGEDYE